MCLNCGCGELNERHTAGDSTLDDMQKTARNHDMPVEQAVDDVHAAVRRSRKDGKAR